MDSILVTGANGFLGSALCSELGSRGMLFKRAIRGKQSGAISIGEIDGSTDWISALFSVDVVVHTAARVHVMQDKLSDPLDEFRRVNVGGTLNLARQAADAGVRRFVFISSIKVNGEYTLPGCPFKADDVPAPQDPYGVSKYEAEEGLRALSAETGMGVVIIRPPLVYGHGVKGNFLSMMRWLRRGVPLPLGGIRNARSLVALDNLVDLIITCIDHPAAVNQVLLVSDGHDLSTSELLYRLGHALGKPARLIPVPSHLLEVGALLFGKQNVAQRLCGSLQVDISKTETLLGWAPPLAVDDGLRRVAQSFIK